MDEVALELGIVDLRRRTLRLRGETRRLTTKEADILAYLAARAGDDVTREELLREVWGYRGSVVSRTVDTTLQRLRGKIERNPREPVHILTVHGMGYRFEPLVEAAPSPPPPPIPTLGPLVGRDAELRDLRERLGTARLVTLVGAGGIGKTALARAVAAERPGAVFCDLCSATTADDIRRVLSRELEVPLTDGKTAGDPGGADGRLCAAMEARGAFLLVLDNLEQTRDEGPRLVSTLLAGTTGTSFLVTSRERLETQHESVVELAPLSVDAAAELFVARARQVRPGFALTDDASREAVRALVQRLDGLPLAVELAAARAGVLGPLDMLRRLDDRFRLLTSRDRSRSERQRTLRGALDWSWDLLDDDERRTLAWCSVFRGGFDANAIDEVVKLDEASDLWPIDVVESLRVKSLITAAPPPGLPGELRLGMLESVREYAAERLDELDLRAPAEACHRDHYLLRGEALIEDLDGPEPVATRRRLALESANLEAVRRRFRHRQPEAAARAALVLDAAFWGDTPAGHSLTMLQEASDGLEECDPLVFRMTIALARAHRHAGDATSGAAKAAEASVRAGSLGGAAKGEAALARGLAETELGRLDVAQTWFEEAEAHFAEAGDLLGRTAARAQLAFLMSQRGKHIEAEPIIRAALAENRSPRRTGKLQSTLGLILAEQTRWEEADAALEAARVSLGSMGDRREAAIVATNLGGGLLQRGRKAEAEAKFEEALQIFRGLGDSRRVGILSRNLGVLAFSEGRDDEAERRLTEALVLHRAMNDGWNVGRALADLGEVMLIQGRYADAAARYRDGLEIARSLGDRRYCAIIAGNQALLDHVAGRLPEAADKYASALAQLDEVTGPRPQGYYRAYAAAMHAESGDIETAKTLLEESRDRLERVGDGVGLAVLEVCTAIVELSAASEAHGEPERARLAASADERLADLGDERLAYDVRVALQLANRIRLD
jgi:predicted ATPase/DNA-binding winged helix-turn-helix (wHTH) protein/Tfp pilus assembly protein PilF